MHWLEKYSQMKYFNRNPLYQNHIIYDFEHDKNAMAKSINRLFIRNVRCLYIKNIQ